MITGWQENIWKQVRSGFKNGDDKAYFTEAKIIFPKILILVRNFRK